MLCGKYLNENINHPRLLKNFEVISPNDRILTSISLYLNIYERFLYPDIILYLAKSNFAFDEVILKLFGVNDICR